MVLTSLRATLGDPKLRDFRFAYGAAMRGSKGDVMRSARGLHPMRLLRADASLALYFVAPAELARLRVDDAPPPPRSPGLDLSLRAADSADDLGLVSTAGRKDLRLLSTGAPWPLEHLALGPAAWRPTWGAMLARAGAALVARGSTAQACFAIDPRLHDHVAWLAAQGLRSTAVCTVYALNLAPSRRSPAWVHLATSEI